MNLASRRNEFAKCLFRTAIKCRTVLPKRRSQAFGFLSTKEHPRIQRIYVINLKRQPARWVEMETELRRILDWSGAELWSLTERCVAVDANHFVTEPPKDSDVDPVYTLADQLFVEPQPLALPTRFELNSLIRMSRPEIAVARSHINVWRLIASTNLQYALVLEDDVWFRPKFARRLDQAWKDVQTAGDGKGDFDILYLSYEEVKNGAPKVWLSSNIFRPARGLWHLSGYVISREGAAKLLRLLPCRGPVDLWINHQFEALNVRATRRPIISQRSDFNSTNSYSILPSLTKIGAITSEGASSFQVRPSERPVFALGSRDSGLSSLAMALSMLGYRCCSDLQSLPSAEHEMLLAGRRDRIFDAYVNIGSISKEVKAIRNLYPEAKVILTTRMTVLADDCDLDVPLTDLDGADLAVLPFAVPDKWRIVCEHLRCAPPACSFPCVPDAGQRQLLCRATDPSSLLNCEIARRDKSPWIVEPRNWWQGIHAVPTEGVEAIATSPVRISDSFTYLDPCRWLLRDDTFTDNLAMFRSTNVEFRSGVGAVLNVRKQPLGVRGFSAASLTSRDRYLFGRFEAVMKASNVAGVVTGFFLHRDSPRQEIDVEIAGNRPDRLLVNVFYNPGDAGAKFDYGYRGAASYIDLGFDASESYHRFAIEWRRWGICWFVDDRLVHMRVEWDPTPVPHLPMALHANAWPSRSKELAGRIDSRRLPTAALLKSIALEADRHQDGTLL